MSEHTTARPVNRSSQPLVWIMSLLSLLVLGIVTAAAVRHNPLYSDRDAYGISTYRLIEECKAELEHPQNIRVGPLNPNQPDTRPTLPDSLRNNMQQQGQQFPANAEVFIRPAGNSSTLVSGIEHPTPVQIQLRTPALVGYHLGSDEHVLGQAPVTCAYNAQSHRVDVLLQ